MTEVAFIKSFDFSDADFEAISKLAYEDFGLHLRENKKALVYSRLVGRVRKLKLRNFSEYCAMLTSAEHQGERLKLLSSLTTNVTRFFREDHHFQLLKSAVFPRLLDTVPKNRPIRIWSAGCSTGQEPYSLALCILDHAPALLDRDIRIQATDVDTDVLKVAEAGVYRADTMNGLAPDQRAKFFEKRADDQWEVCKKVRDLVTFEHLNLMRDWSFSHRFDIIFCRNVAIYFNNETQAKLWTRFAEIMNPDAHLSIGHSERLSGPALQYLKSIGQTSYVRNETTFGKAHGNPL